MPRVKITVDMIDEARPVARGGLMLIDLTCDMTTGQMFQAIQAMRECVTGKQWLLWLDMWNGEDCKDEEFPHQGKDD